MWGSWRANAACEPGEEVTLYATGTTPPGNGLKKIPVDFRQLFDSCRLSDRLLLDDGRLALEVVSVKERNALTAKVVVGGRLSSHKGINLPGVRLRIAGFTEKDEADLAFGISQGVDAVAISFVRTVDDVKKVRYAMERFSNGKRLPLLIAKLEKPEALDNLNEILENVDGVMVARGDLGVELPPERVPVQQKHIIRTANLRAKLVITATQMLKSMITNPLPTRAEASDVANAVFDGTDAVMLSAETAVGKYPVEAIQMMDRIVREAESHYLEWGVEQHVSGFEHSDAASMARAAQALANDENVTAVACFTTQGQTAWLMSKIRPRVPIMAFTPDPRHLSASGIFVGRPPAACSVRQFTRRNARPRGSGAGTLRCRPGGRPGRAGVWLPGWSDPPAKHGSAAYSGGLAKPSSLSGAVGVVEG